MTAPFVSKRNPSPRPPPRSEEGKFGDFHTVTATGTTFNRKAAPIAQTPPLRFGEGAGGRGNPWLIRGFFYVNRVFNGLAVRVGDTENDGLRFNQHQTLFLPGFHVNGIDIQKVSRAF